jgi:hypothetical protein
MLAILGYSIVPMLNLFTLIGVEMTSNSMGGPIMSPFWDIITLHSAMPTRVAR